MIGKFLELLTGNPLPLIIDGGKSLLTRVPRWAWIALAIVVALGLSVHLHQVKAHAAIDAAEKRGEAAADSRNAKQLKQARADALAWKLKADAAATNLANELRKRTDENARTVAALADDLRMRGAGAAAARNCRPVGPAGLADRTGGYNSPGGAGDPAGAAVPAADGLAVVPWNWLVDRGKQADLNRAEALTWREWFTRYTAWFDAQRAAATKRRK